MAIAAAPDLTPPHAVYVRAATTHVVAPTLHALRRNLLCPHCTPVCVATPLHALRASQPVISLLYAMCVVTASFPVRRDLLLPRCTPRASRPRHFPAAHLRASYLLLSPMYAMCAAVAFTPFCAPMCVVIIITPAVCHVHRDLLLPSLHVTCVAMRLSLWHTHVFHGSCSV
jgi:hypothetical protein